MMISFPLSKLTLLLAVTSLAHEGLALDDSSNDAMRQASPRMRGAFSNVAAAGVIQPRQGVGPVIVEEAEDTMTTELMDSMMSMDVTVEPTDSPSAGPSGGPSLAPTSITSAPSVSMMPSTGPSASQAPSPSAPTTEAPSSSPTIAPTASPMLAPTNAPTIAPATAGPTVAPTDAPSVPDTQIGVIVTDTPTTSPSQGPTSTPSTSPTRLPSTSAPTAIPTVEGCSVSADVREQLILEILDNAADPVAIRDPTTAQGQATEWLLNDDFRKLCPDTPKILQRWVLAVTYFSTGGNDWLKCSANFLANDDCGNEEIFGNKTRFLSGFSECEWAGITCADDICVTEIEFEDNNLRGTIPTEVGLLTDLNRWGMERGNLTGTIPTEIESLSKLTFLDLDFNVLTGSLTTQLLSLVSLEQLDLNDNNMTGSINGIGVFPNMTFLQLHRNEFTGTVPAEVGGFLGLTTFTLHKTLISGSMPQPVCDLRQVGEIAEVGGALTSLIASCAGNNPDIACDCCSSCRTGI